MNSRRKPRRILRRPREPLGGNLGVALFDLARGGPVLLITRRVGDVRGLPRGYELDSCAHCGAACWVNGSFMAHARRRGLEVRVECSGCTPFETT